MFDFQFLKKLPIVSVRCGWWDSVFAELTILFSIELKRSMVTPDLPAFTYPPTHPLEYLLDVLYVFFFLRTIYAIHQYFPYGRRGHTFWYPIAESIVIYLGAYAFIYLYQSLNTPLFLNPFFKMLGSVLGIFCTARFVLNGFMLWNNTMVVFYRVYSKPEDRGSLSERSNTTSTQEQDFSAPLAIQTTGNSSELELPTETNEVEEVEAEFIDDDDVIKFGYRQPPKQIKETDRPRLPLKFPPWRKP